jgi:putative transposase
MHRFIDEHRNEYRVSELCSAQELSPGGYYRWRTRGESARRQRDRDLLEKIRHAHQQSDGVYGSPRVFEDLKDAGEHVGRKRVERLMRDNAIVGAMPQRRRWVTTSSKHGYAIAENLLACDFTAEAPNRKRVVDITYIATMEGWLYLATVIDLFSRRIVGWAMSERIEQELTLTALRMALLWRKPDSSLEHHSDRGVQYAATQYRQLLRDWNLAVSLSRKGNCYDNAVVESWHCMLKVELVWRTKYQTRSEARGRIFKYIAVFYNQKRRHSSLGYLSPAQFERQHAENHPADT